jgi:hypothetical protein
VKDRQESPSPVTLSLKARNRPPEGGTCSPSVAGHNVGRRTPKLIVRATLEPGGGERWRFEAMS